MADLDFYFDPVCPFAWMTSKWIRQVARKRAYDVEWRFISLRQINAAVDYDAQFPPGYEAGHTAGLRLLRVAARTRLEHGPTAVGQLYEQLGAAIFDIAPAGDIDDAAAREARGTREFLMPVLGTAGLPAELADALEDDSYDAQIQAETDEALGLTGRDVGTPIIHFQPPTGTAFFGPVISRLPSEADGIRLWDHVIGLASFGGFAELKRSLRETPQLAAFGVSSDHTGRTEDWHAGSRRTHK